MTKKKTYKTNCNILHETIDELNQRYERKQTPYKDSEGFTFIQIGDEVYYRCFGNVAFVTSVRNGNVYAKYFEGDKQKRAIVGKVIE